MFFVWSVKQQKKKKKELQNDQSYLKMWAKGLLGCLAALSQVVSQETPNYRILPYSVESVQYPRQVRKFSDRRDTLEMKQVCDRWEKQFALIGSFHERFLKGLKVTVVKD